MTPTLVTVSVISLLQDAASELVYPLLPLLLTGVLAAAPVVVGMVEGTATGVAALVAYVSGRGSDRIGRRPLVLAGYSLAAAGKVVVAAAWVWPIVLVGRVVDRFGKGVRGAPRDALIVDAVPPEAVGRAFGFHRAMDTAGAVLGPLLALAALAVLDDDLRAVLWVAVVPAVASALLVLRIQEPRPTTAAREPAAPARPSPGDTPGTGGAPGLATVESPVAPLPRRLRTLLTLLGVFAVVNFPDALLLLRLSELGWGASAVVGGYLLYTASYAFGSYPAGHLADRWPRATVYALGLACFAAGYLALGILDSGWGLAAALVVYGGFSACTDGVGKAWIASLSPVPARGRAQGAHTAVTSGGVFVAGLWAGLLWTAGPGDGVVPLLVSGSVAALAAIVLATYGRRFG